MNQISMFQRDKLNPDDDPPELAPLLDRCSVIYKPKGLALEYANLATNAYRGCRHGCAYCYAPSALRMSASEFHSAPSIRKGYLAKLEKDCAKFQKANMGGRVLLSFTCDPYQPLDEDTGLTRRVIQTMHAAGLDVQVLTKGGARALRDLDLFGPTDAFATTLTWSDRYRSILWEPEAALPAERIETIKAFHDAGVPTWVSLEPVLDPNVALDLIRTTAPFVDLFKVGKLNYAGRLPPELRATVEHIDWYAFGHAAESLLQELGKEYYIKIDLRVLMDR